MWSRSSMFVILYFSLVGRRSWVDVASTNTSRSAGNDPNAANSRRASWGARKKSTYRQVSPPRSPVTTKCSANSRFSLGISEKNRRVDGRRNPPPKRWSMMGIPEATRFVTTETLASGTESAPPRCVEHLRGVRNPRPGRADREPSHVVRADLTRKVVGEPDLDDPIDEGPEERRRVRVVDPVVHRVCDEPDVRLHAARDDLDELRDRLRGVVEEQGGDRVEEDPDRRLQVVGRLRDRHPDPFEVAKARHGVDALRRGRLESLRGRGGVAVDERERTPLCRGQLKARRQRPRTHLVGVEVEGDERDPFPRIEKPAGESKQELELSHAGGTRHEDRGVASVR